MTHWGFRIGVPLRKSVGNANPGRGQDRREGFRVTADRLSAKAWRMDLHGRLRDRVLPSRRLPMTVIDMGRGGLSAIVPSTCLLHEGDRVHLELPTVRSAKHNIDDDDAAALVCEVRVIYVNAIREEECRIGLQFQPALSEALARRFQNAQDRLLAALQRDELRRQRTAAA